MNMQIDNSDTKTMSQLYEQTMMIEFDKLCKRRGKVTKKVDPEVLCVGFRRCWINHDYETILNVAHKVPEDVISNNLKLQLYVDSARTRARPYRW